MTTTSAPALDVGRSLRFCHDHGDYSLCYEQTDGKHITASSCTCRRAPSSLCPVDAHRELRYDSDAFGEAGRVYGVRSI